MCRIRNCKRHEFDKGLCLTHLKEAKEAGVQDLWHWSPKDTRNKTAAPVAVESVDALVLNVADDTTKLETRDEGDSAV